MLEIEGEIWAIEVKLTTAPSLGDMRRLDKAADLIGASRRYLISQTHSPAGDEYRASGSLSWFLERLRAREG